jgi:RNA polymerase sigma factor (sigma-70 family)
MPWQTCQVKKAALARLPAKEEDQFRKSGKPNRAPLVFLFERIVLYKYGRRRTIRIDFPSEGRIVQTAALKCMLDHLRQQAGAAAMKDLSDTDLLERFRSRREEAAFTLLVQRHGPMVLGVCRRILGDAHAAEDAFQNTFLVLVRKAGSLRKSQSLASWLYGVAYRTAARSRLQSTRRRTGERSAATPQPPFDALEALSRAELYAVLDEEIGQLSDKYRRPLVLCCLEGKTYEQAAQELAWPKSTVSARLKRACELLRQRLTRRGITLPAGALAALLAEQTAARAVPAVLILSTVRLAAQMLAGHATTALPIVTLFGGMVKGMITTKLGAALTLLFVVGLTVAGVGVLASPKEEPKTATPPREARRTEPPKPESVEVVRADQYGDPLPDGALARFGTTRLRHPGVQRLVFGVDGKTILSFGRDLSLRQWDLSSGKPTASRSITLPPDDPPSYAQGKWPILSPDGKTLAFVTEKNLYFFDATDGKELSRLPSEEGLEAKEFMPDSKQLAVTKFIPNKPHELRLFDVAAGTSVNTGVPWKNRDDAFAFDAKGKQFAIFNHSNSTVTLWALSQGECLHTIRGLNWVDALAFAPDGKRLFVAAAAKEKVFIWNTTSFKEEAPVSLTHDLGYVRTLAVSADGSQLAVASRDGIVLYDANTTKEIRKLAERLCWKIWFFPDSKTLAGATGSAMRLWNVADGRPLHDGDSHDEVTAVAYSPDGKRLASGGDWGNSRIYIWDVATTKCLTTIRRPWDLGPLLFSQDGQTLFGAAGFGTVKAWNVADGKEKAVFVTADNKEERGNQNIKSLQLSRDGKRLSPVSRDREVFLVVVWDFGTGKCLSRTKVSERIPWHGQLAPDGRLLAYEYGPHVVLYDLTAKQARATLPSSWPHLYSFSHDSTLLATLTPNASADSKPADQCVNLWETATGKLRIAFPTGQVEVIHKLFTPDKRFLLTTSKTDLQLWEIATGKEVLRRGVVEMMRGKGTWFSEEVAVAPDGRSAAMGMPDGNIIVWDLLPSSRRQADLKAKDMNALWTDLGSEEAAIAYHAGTRLLSAPETVAAFLSKQLRPSADETKRIRGLITALDDNEFTKREAARKELEQLGLVAEPELRRTLDGKPSAETLRAVEVLLAEVWTVRTAEERQQIRAVWVLEQIGSSEARKILERLADGAAGAWQTREAKASLQRLEAKKE